MFRLFKILWDVIVLRENAKKGNFSWLVTFVAVIVVFLGYAIVLGAATFCEKHPGHDWLQTAAMVFALLNLIVFLIWGWHYQKRLAAARKAAPAATAQNQ